MLPELAALEKILDLGAPHLEVQVVQQVSVASGPQLPIYAIGLGNPALDVPAVGFFGGVHGLERIGAENQRSQSGLDLGIIDHYNGTRRSVKTLSGGESFKASLALALGLSDEVQSAAGGIRLDTLFLDEGFGSLDDESLEQAMRVLAGLTEGDRLVGIISHVGALKDRIDRQVVVRKARTGGSTVELIV